MAPLPKSKLIFVTGYKRLKVLFYAKYRESTEFITKYNLLDRVIFSYFYTSGRRCFRVRFDRRKSGKKPSVSLRNRVTRETRTPENRFLPPRARTHVQPPVHRPCVLDVRKWLYTGCAHVRTPRGNNNKKKNPPNSIAKPQRKNTCFWPSTNRFVIVAGPGFKSISRSRTFQRRPSVAFRFARHPLPSLPGNDGGRKLFRTVFMFRLVGSVRSSLTCRLPSSQTGRPGTDPDTWLGRGKDRVGP